MKSLLIFKKENGQALMSMNGTNLDEFDLNKFLEINSLTESDVGIVYDDRVFTHHFTIKNGKVIFGEIKNLEDLSLIKENKIEQLKILCNEDIEFGFISKTNSHHYRTNRDDQTNFIGKFNQVQLQPEVLTVMWKTEDAGYIEHSREEWIQIFYEGLTSKEEKLFKYDTLKNKVESSKTKEEVNNISW